MRSKTMTYVLFGLVILIFIGIYLTQNAILKAGSPIINELNNISKCARQNKWEDAQKWYERLSESWSKAKYPIAINYAEADYSLFLDNLSKIKGAIRTEDETETICQTKAAIVLLNNFFKLCPEP